jgi:hypothetical protein
MAGSQGTGLRKTKRQGKVMGEKRGGRGRGMGRRARKA